MDRRQLKGIKILNFSTINRNIEKQANVIMLINTYPGFPDFYYIVYFRCKYGVGEVGRRYFRDVARKDVTNLRYKRSKEFLA